MLTQPVQAMRDILHRPATTTRTWFLILVYVAVAQLSTMTFAPPNERPLPAVLTGLFILFGFLVIVLLGTLVTRLLKGQASWKEQVAAFMWGQLPAFLALLVLTVAALAVQAATGKTLPEWIRTVGNVVGLVWSTGITANTVAVVNRFNWRRGLIVALVPLMSGVLSYL